MPASGSEDSDDSQIPSTRVERLLRERALRKNRDHEVSTDNESDEGLERKPIKQRLLVVANRLPLSAKRNEDDSWSLEISAGGLVSALVGVKEFEARYIGWPGVSVPDEAGQQTLTAALSEKRCIPVFLSEEIVNQYYNGYCNNILWPLFHYLGLPHEDRLATTKTFQSQFEAYKTANTMFADVVNEHYQEGDIVWCHDYHLMFLPKKLKEDNPNMKVGWFLHTSFPSSEIFRTLPSRSELLCAVLAADLVGFHTYDYARHFLSACTRILGLEGTPEGVEDQGRVTRVAAFPIGIDSDRFIHALEDPRVQAHIRDYKARFSGKKVILGVDRLDTIKGIPQKILAFEKFLEENPNWHDKVVLVQIAVPTRTEVPQYIKLMSQVHEIVGRVNGRFGTLTAVPVHHLDQSLHFHELCALYSLTDVAVVTSLRDGMNLVSYEFVACQDSKRGVLILSEFAGAAQSLGAGAILINPWNITEVAAAIDQALSMSAQERGKRHQYNFKHVTTHTAQKWAELFLCELNDTVIEAQQRTSNAPPELVASDAVGKYLQSNNRLLILGFNGAITEPIESPNGRGADQIKEMELKLHHKLKEPLAMLCRDPNTIIVVLSGSDRSVLDDNFGEYDMWLAAENGMFLRSTKGEWMTTMPEHLNVDWVDRTKQLFEYFTERTPRSRFEQRDTSLVWNYRFTDLEFGRSQVRDMLQHLWTGPISNSSVDVFQGSRSVEVRAVGVTKGAAIHRIIGEIIHSKADFKTIDYVLCLGHFLEKDEDVYKFFEPELPPEALRKRRLSIDKKSTTGSTPSSSRQESPKTTTCDVLDLKRENYFSCAVGRTRTSARYQINTTDDVVSLLKNMATATLAN